MVKSKGHYANYWKVGDKCQPTMWLLVMNTAKQPSEVAGSSREQVTSRWRRLNRCDGEFIVCGGWGGVGVLIIV